MIARWQWILLRTSRRLGVRASLFSLLGIATALVALLLKQYIPTELPARIGSDAVDNLLGIIASSMLAVTTFSLTTMVSAYTSATSNVTPRATSLLIEDSTTQNALATFLGSFLFSLVGIIALSTGLYGEQGRVLLFAVTLLVLALIVITLVRWIDHLASLGRVGETSDRVERAASAALREVLARPCLGGSPLYPGQPLPEGAQPVFPARIGYVQHLDMPALAELSGEHGAIYVQVLPGAFVDTRRPIAWCLGLDAAERERVAAAFTLGVQRSYEQDPRFGVSVLAEIASRALSPAINDPGTAIEVLGRGVRVLALYADYSGYDPQRGPRPECPRVLVPPLALADLFDDLFTPIARDGAALVEVGMRLQKSLAALARLGEPFASEARRHARLALARAEAVLDLEEDRQCLRTLCAALEDPPPHP